MLTEAEKKWLHERKNVERWAFCLHCPQNKKTPSCRGWIYDFCPIKRESQDFEDAAKFEARVAALMPFAVFVTIQHQIRKTKDIWIDAATSLKLARITVEEEMELSV